MQQVFSFTMTTGPLPFPSKIKEDKVIPTPSKEEEPEEEVEVTRFGEKKVIFRNNLSHIV